MGPDYVAAITVAEASFSTQRRNIFKVWREKNWWIFNLFTKDNFSWSEVRFFSGRIRHRWRFGSLGTGQSSGRFDLPFENRKWADYHFFSDNTQCFWPCIYAPSCPSTQIDCAVFLATSEKRTRVIFAVSSWSNKRGLNTKLHALCDGIGRPLIQCRSDGQLSDHFGAKLIYPAMPNAKVLIGDKGYDSDEIRDALKAKNITPCIPPRSNRAAPSHYSKTLYKQHHKVENMLAEIKDWRRIATWYDRCDIHSCRQSASQQ